MTERLSDGRVRAIATDAVLTSHDPVIEEIIVDRRALAREVLEARRAFRQLVGILNDAEEASLGDAFDSCQEGRSLIAKLLAPAPPALGGEG